MGQGEGSLPSLAPFCKTALGFTKSPPLFFVSYHILLFILLLYCVLGLSIFYISHLYLIKNSLFFCVLPYFFKFICFFTILHLNIFFVLYHIITKLFVFYHILFEFIYVFIKFYLNLLKNLLFFVSRHILFKFN